MTTLGAFTMSLLLPPRVLDHICAFLPNLPPSTTCIWKSLQETRCKGTPSSPTKDSAPEDGNRRRPHLRSGVGSQLGRVDHMRRSISDSIGEERRIIVPEHMRCSFPTTTTTAVPSLLSVPSRSKNHGRLTPTVTGSWQRVRFVGLWVRFPSPRDILRVHS